MLGQSLKGFEAAEANPRTPPDANQPGAALGRNRYIRCPLPPFSATVDTMRQFNESGKVPATRVIPLPPSTSTGAGLTLTRAAILAALGSGVGTNTNISGGGAGGGSSSSQTTLNEVSVVINIPALSPLGVYQATVQMAKSFQLIQMISTVPVEVRLYANASTQGADVVRLTDTAVAFEVVPAIFTDVVFDTPPYTWNWQNRIAANADSPQSLNIYVNVVNPSPTTGTSPGTITIVYLPLAS